MVGSWAEATLGRARGTGPGGQSHLPDLDCDVALPPLWPRPPRPPSSTLSSQFSLPSDICTC